MNRQEAFELLNSIAFTGDYKTENGHDFIVNDDIKITLDNDANIIIKYPKDSFVYDITSRSKDEIIRLLSKYILLLTESQLSELESAGAKFCGSCDLGNHVEATLDGIATVSLVLESSIKITTPTGLRMIVHCPFGCRLLPLISSEIKKLEDYNTEVSYAKLKISILDAISRIVLKDSDLKAALNSITESKDTTQLFEAIKDHLHTLLYNRVLDTSLMSSLSGEFDDHGISINHTSNPNNDILIIINKEYRFNSGFSKVYIIGKSEVTFEKCKELYVYDGASVSVYRIDKLVASGLSNVTAHYSTDVISRDKARVNLVSEFLTIESFDESRVIVDRLSIEEVKVHDSAKVIELTKNQN